MGLQTDLPLSTPVIFRIGRRWMQSTFDERNWLPWLVKVRILILTFLLAMELAIAHLTPAHVPLRILLGTIFVWFGTAFGYVFLLTRWRAYRTQAALQVLTDLLMVSLMVLETGGWDSSLNLLDRKS